MTGITPCECCGPAIPATRDTVFKSNINNLKVLLRYPQEPKRAKNAHISSKSASKSCFIYFFYLFPFTSSLIFQLFFLLQQAMKQLYIQYMNWGEFQKLHILEGFPKASQRRIRMTCAMAPFIKRQFGVTIPCSHFTHTLKRAKRHPGMLCSSRGGRKLIFQLLCLLCIPCGQKLARSNWKLFALKLSPHLQDSRAKSSKRR